MCLAELAGTYLLVLLGCGVVHASVLTGTQSGLWQVAIVWGIAIMLAVYTRGAVSGARINPAITLALAVWRGFAWRLVVPYVFAQVIGAFLAAATLFVLFNPYLKARELEKDVVRGTPGSEITAMCYGEFFPSPGPLSNASGRYSVDAHERLNSLVSEQAAFLAELLGTLVLALVVFAVTDEGNPGAPPSGFAPVIVGLTVAVLISVIAPLTQACFNRARDFGPRLFASLAGWGRIALPGRRGIGFVSVYIVAPLLAAIIGSGLYTKLLKPSSAVDSDTANRSRERC
jgi:glycerol uptake facilitator protein